MTFATGRKWAIAAGAVLILAGFGGIVAANLAEPERALEVGKVSTGKAGRVEWYTAAPPFWATACLVAGGALAVGGLAVRRQE